MPRFTTAIGKLLGGSAPSTAADDAARSALTLDDTRAEARVLAFGDDPGAAEAYLQQAMARFPQDAELTLLHGASLMLTDPARAQSLIATAVELDATNLAILVEAASRMLSLGETEAARSYGNRAYEFRGDDPSFTLMPVLLHIGAELAAIDGDDARAEEGFQQLVDLYPDDTEFLCTFARFLASRDRLTEAQTLLDEAVDICDDPDALKQYRSGLGN